MCRTFMSDIFDGSGYRRLTGDEDARRYNTTAHYELRTAEDPLEDNTNEWPSSDVSQTGLCETECLRVGGMYSRNSYHRWCK